MTGDPKPPDPTPRPKPGLPTAAFLFAGALLLYLVTLQESLYGDGIFYLSRAAAGELVGHHPLYPPFLAAAVGLGRLLGLAPITAGTLLSALAGAGAVALSFPFFLGWCGGRRGFALFASLLLMVSPVTWFFATTIENHALHLLFVLLFLVALDRAARRGGGLPALVPGLLLVPAYLSHTSALMLIPFALAAFFLRWAGPGEGDRWLPAALGAGALLLLPAAITKLLLPELYTLLNYGADPFHGHDPSGETLKLLMSRAGVEPGIDNWLWNNPLRLIEYTFRHLGTMAAHVRDDFFAHSALAGLLSFLGVIPALFVAPRRGASWLLLLLLAFLPYAWLWSFWGFQPPEKGAYYLPILPVTLGAGLAGILAALPRAGRLSRALPAAAVILLLAQAAVALNTINSYELGNWRRRWCDDAARLAAPAQGRGGIVVTGDGHLLFYLRYYQGERLQAALMIGELLPPGTPPKQEGEVGREVARQAELWRRGGHAIFAGREFWRQAARHPAFLAELDRLPWRPAAAGEARGRILR